jgi:hypothetical protein
MNAHRDHAPERDPDRALSPVFDPEDEDDYQGEAHRLAATLDDWQGADE